MATSSPPPARPSRPSPQQTDSAEPILRAGLFTPGVASLHPHSHHSQPARSRSAASAPTSPAAFSHVHVSASPESTGNQRAPASSPSGASDIAAASERMRTLFATQPRPARASAGASHSFTNTPTRAPLFGPTSNDDEEDDESPQPHATSGSRLFATHQHPELRTTATPVHVDGVARSMVGTGTTPQKAAGTGSAPQSEKKSPYTFVPATAPAAAAATSSPFAPFSPSELRPYSAPSPANANGSTTAAAAATFPPFSPSELRSPTVGLQPKFGSGFSPRHSHWDANHEYDEAYPCESPQSSPRLPAREVAGSPPRLTSLGSSDPKPKILMSPSTRNAADSLVPSISWLLILNRKLLLSGAITQEQSRHLKTQILAGRPELLSAVDRFVQKESQDAIIQALLNCLPEVAQSEVEESEPEESEPEGPAEYSDSDGDYRAITNGRGQGGHKSKTTHARASDSDGDSDLNASHALEFDSESDDEIDEDENPLVVANSLLPLSLPQLESLSRLIRELGFPLLDLETLTLCTSSLLPPGATAGGPVSVPPVTLRAWQECIKDLRLHSHSPKLFTNVLTAIFKALDLHQNNSVPYGELVSSLAVFCRASAAQRLKFVFNAMSNNAAAAPVSVSAAPQSPPDQAAAQALSCTAIYGWCFSWSTTLHVLLRLSDPAASSSASPPQSLHDRTVWTLTNKLYALLDAQFSPRSDIGEDEDAFLSYGQFVQWRRSPAFLLDTLLERAATEQ